MDLHTLADTVANVARAAWALNGWFATIAATSGLIAIAHAARIGGAR